jgi:polysaccharide deacetylase family protein (PEP-CTERM system associated)
MKPEAFADDLRRSIQLIESQIGKKPIGYRAPAFSISKETMWCGPIMADLGIRYSSSIFPIAGRRYGIPDAPRFPHRWPNCNVIEFPLTTLRRFGRNLPACGGGYLRMLPVPVLSAAIRGANRQRQPAVVYLHPYELAVNELDVLRQRGWRIAWRTHLHQSLFRGRVAARLAALCRRFKFAPMGTVLGFDKTAPACPVTTRPDNAAVSPQRQGLITVESST